MAGVGVLGFKYTSGSVTCIMTSTRFMLRTGFDGHFIAL